MIHDSHACYQACTSRDARFDGVIFLGVTSTKIYCRPVCPAKKPQLANCRFFSNPESAEKAGFRPCLRCRPELAPGAAPVDDAQRIAMLLSQRMDENLLAGESGMEDIAAQFDLSSRQVRRIIQKEFGVSPIQLVQTRRLLLAKQLLTETLMPVREVASASGFSSLRRFNDAFLGGYGLAPSHLRKAAAKPDGSTSSGTFTLQLAYRPPFDWDGLLAFLRGRCLKGVETVDDGTYLRTVRIGDCIGWVRVGNQGDRNVLRVDLSQSLTPAIPVLLGRLRNLFDLRARPDLINAHLAADVHLAPLIERNPGLRVPGAFDGFEMAVRAILGQQVTVKAATTLAGRFAQRFGEPVETPMEKLTHLAPTAERMADTTVDEIAGLGIIASRARSIIAIAQAVNAGRLKLEAGAHPDAAMAQLMALPGIGAWTAHYLAMRALRWPDAFPKEDIALRNRLGGVSPREAERLSQPWRPWRSYATLHLWQTV